MNPAPATTDLTDAWPQLCRVCPVQFRQFGGVRKFCGEIRTVQCAGDNALVRGELTTPGAGRVLVVDGGGTLTRALLGDQLAALAVRNRWAGIVIFGAVRDSAALAGVPLGIKALGTCPVRSEKLGTGLAGGDVMIGGVRFRSGQWLCSDDDGLVVADTPLSV
ncbi:MAG: ribonuclease E activity regulator RraA [Opitutales bacterium]